MTSRNGEPLAGRRVVVTREHAGELDRRLRALGADVDHVPMIETADAPDGGEALRRALEKLDRYVWLVVTSPTGARKVVDALGQVDDAGVSFACVGEATAEVFREIGLSPALVPSVARLEGLLDVFPDGEGAVLLARADQADPRLVEGLRAKGWGVDEVVAYRTVGRTPDEHGRRHAAGADAVVLASGSAALAWKAAFGTDGGHEVIVIGPSTAAVASGAGLNVDAIATEQSIDGIVETVVQRLGSEQRS